MFLSENVKGSNSPNSSFLEMVINNDNGLCTAHLSLVPHVRVSESGHIGSDNGLSPIRRQAII